MFSKIAKYSKTTRFKTTLWYSAVFLMLEVVIGILIYGFLKHNLYKELDFSLTKQAEMIYQFVEESHVNLQDFKADSIYNSPNELIYALIFEVVAFNPNNTFVQVSYKGQTVFSTVNLKDNIIKNPDSLAPESGLFSFSDSLLSKHAIRAAYLNQSDYKILVAFPTQVVNQTLDNLTDIYVLIAPIFFLLSLIGGSVISFRALSRIDKIINETNAITALNLDKIIEGSEYGDEYGRLVMTMNKMIKRIKTSIDYINQFSISVSHELKTPLTILRGELELALKSKKTPQDYREVLESNHEEVLRLINIIEHLFYISRLENSLIKINKIPTELKSFIYNIIHSIKNLAKDKGMNLIWICEILEDVNVMIDPELFRQVVINLIDNAIKFGRANSDILIKCEKKIDGKILLSFTNSGEEIPKEILPKLFDRFYRAESSRNRNMGGIGLGLSIVKSIVDLHQGEVLAECSSDGRIIFTIII